MSLDPSKLENARQCEQKIIARCPACAQQGHDQKGNHLVIMPDGRFGCVTCPGAGGKKHRQKIYALAGDKTASCQIASNIRVHRPVLPESPEIAVSSPDPGQVGTAGTPFSNPRATDKTEMDHDDNKESPAQKDSDLASQASHGVPEVMDELERIFAVTKKMLGGLAPYIVQGIEQQREWLELSGWVELADDSETIRALKRTPTNMQAVAAFHVGIMVMAALKAGADDETTGIIATDAVRGLLRIGQNNPDTDY